MRSVVLQEIGEYMHLFFSSCFNKLKDLELNLRSNKAVAFPSCHSCKELQRVGKRGLAKKHVKKVG